MSEEERVDAIVAEIGEDVNERLVSMEPNACPMDLNSAFFGSLIRAVARAIVRHANVPQSD